MKMACRPRITLYLLNKNILEILIQSYLQILHRCHATDYSLRKLCFYI